MKNSARLFLCIITLGLVAGCGTDDSTQSCPNSIQLELFGGVPDNMSAHEGVVKIMQNIPGKGYYKCSGTLIAPGIVLTAAHCLCHPPDPLTRPWTITAKDCFPADVDPAVDTAYVWLSSYNKDYPVEGGYFEGRVIIHPEFAATYDKDGFFIRVDNDIAVIKLSKPADKVIKPIAITEKSPETCSKLTIVGFGVNDLNDAGAETGFGIRRQGQAVLTKVTSDFLYTNFLGAEPKVLLGHGDSGGPALAIGKDGMENVVGVASGEDEKGLGHFANVKSDRDWILAQ